MVDIADKASSARRAVAGGRIVMQAETLQPPSDQPRKVGRPAKGYRATNKEINVAYPVRRYDLLSELLVQVIQRLSPERAPQIAEEVGREYGRELSAAIGMPGDNGYSDTVSAVVKALTGIGVGVTEIEGRLVTRDSVIPPWAGGRREGRYS